jgi:hypothetical protein
MEREFALQSFGGFGNSVYLYAETLSECVEDFAVNIGRELNEEDFEIDTKQLMHDIAETYTIYMDTLYKKVFGDGVSLSFNKVESPSDYTYLNDVIVATLTVDKPEEFYAKVRSLMRENSVTIAPMIRENHTSRDGYFSRLSPDINVWLEEGVLEADHHYLQYLEYAMDYVTMAVLGIDDLERNFQEDWYCDSYMYPRNYLVCINDELSKELY